MPVRHSPVGVLSRLVVLALLVASCSKDAVGPGRPPSAPVSLEIVPGAILLSGVGATERLRVRARDASGAEVPAPAVTWTASSAGTVSIGSDGTLTGIALGSTTISAAAGDLRAAPILAVVAQLAPGVVTIPDSLVVAGPIEPLDSTAAYGPGWRYRVRLRQAVTPGQNLVGTGAAAIFGRVEAVQQVGPDFIVTLSLRPLPELAPGLVINEQLAFGNADAELAADAAPFYTVRREIDGSVTLVPRASEPLLPQPLSGAAARSGAVRSGAWAANVLPTLETEFKIGPFTCKAEGSTFALELPMPTIRIDPALTYTIDIGLGGINELMVAGQVNSRVGFSPRFKSAFSGEVECRKKDIWKPRIPIAGPWSLLVGGYVPIGIGLKLDGELTLLSLGFNTSDETTASFRLGVSCSGECNGVAEFAHSSATTFQWVLPDLLSDFRLNVKAFPYVSAGFSIGGPIGTADILGDLEIVTGKFGVTQSADVAPRIVQVNDTAAASEYRLKLKVQAGAGDLIQQVIGAIGELIGIADLKLPSVTLFEPTLARSPVGRFDPARVEAALGDSVTIRITMDTTTYLGAQALDSITLYVEREGELGGIALTPLAEPCRSLLPSSGNVLQCRTLFEEGGTRRIRAYVHPRIFGVSLPTPLLLGPQQVLVVQVDAEPLEIIRREPRTAFVGRFYVDTIHVNGGDENNQWSIDGGALPPGIQLGVTSGRLIGTPTTAGDYPVRLRVANGERTDTATFTVRVVPPLAIATAALPPATVGVAYTTTLQATGGPDEPRSWRVTGGALPPGLVLSAAGVVSGQPEQAGNFAVTVRVDAGEAFAVRTYQLSVAATAGNLRILIAPRTEGQLSIPGFSLPDARNGQPYSTVVPVDGPSNTAISGRVQSRDGIIDCVVTDGALSGTCDADYPSGTVVVLDSRPLPGSLMDGWSAPCPTSGQTTGVEPAISCSVSVFGSVTRTAFYRTHEWSIVSGFLPNGLTLDPRAGVIFGTPFANPIGLYQARIRVTAAGQTAERDISIFIF